MGTLRREIDFIGIGAPKTGTSWLFKCLQEHPQVCVPPSKELHFFDLDTSTNQNINWYYEQFLHCSEESVRGEITPTYLVAPHAPERIKSHFPKIKIIVIVRNPVERATSHIRHLQSRNKISTELENKLSRVLENNPDIIENGLYGKHIERYLEMFGKDQVLVLEYEQLANEPATLLSTVYSFIGVGAAFIPRGIYKRYNTSASRSSRLFWYINKLYLKLRSNLFGKKIISTAKKTGITVQDIDNFFQKYKTGTVQKVLSEEDEKILKYYFKKDIKLLEQLLSRDFSHWK